jgi:V/A-type H+-transporting ATPase subunit D
MPELGEVAATRVALLELRDERRLVQEGYDLLDEKRVLLATAILRELRAYVAADQQLATLWRAAREALAAAVEIHGIDDLTVEPPFPLDEALLRTSRHDFLGLRLRDAVLDAPVAMSAVIWSAEPVRDTPELRRCALAFRAVAIELVAQAARAANLRLLVEDYRRTERRARALENVLLPEIDRSVAFIEEQLDAVDQEEAVRVRNAARAR